MKYCSNCNLTKEHTEFYISKGRSDGFHIYCKSCSKQKNKEWKAKNTTQVYEYNKTWVNSNKDKISKNYKNWQINNRAKVNSYNSFRRAVELQATPSWLTESQNLHIQCKYSLAQMLSRETGIQYHVDHIVPLKGKTVCGLHVSWNLQVIPAVENLRKSNKV